MALSDIFYNHRSIRKYTNKEIPEKIANDILHAGTRASTSGNMQLYSMVVTQDIAVKDQLWEAHFKQNMVKEAPMVITFCADFNRFIKWCQYREANPGYDNFLSFTTAAIDAVLVSQNVSLAAEENGLGICYLGTTTYNAKKIIDILNLPKYVIPITTLVIGYPDEAPDLTDRLPLEGVIHKDVYKDYDKYAIDSIYKEKENSELTKRLLEENKKETLAQIYTDNRYKKEDNVLFSKNLLNILEEQGFMNQ